MWKYQHVLRLMDDYQADLHGLLKGEVNIFSKLDGANHCVWAEYDSDRTLSFHCGSRNRELTSGWDSTGFFKYCQNHPNVMKMAFDNPEYVFYGEFMIPHTIRDYDEGTYGEWFIFDVMHKDTERYANYYEYHAVCDQYDVQCIPPIGTLRDPTFEKVSSFMSRATYRHGNTPGEGIVIKNYYYQNDYGKPVWGKLLNSDFVQVRDKHKTEGYSEESRWVEDHLTYEFVNKEKCKYVDEVSGEWNDTLIGVVLPIIRAEFINDYAADIINGLGSIDVKELNKAISRTAVKYLRR